MLVLEAESAFYFGVGGGGGLSGTGRTGGSCWVLPRSQNLPVVGMAVVWLFRAQQVGGDRCEC